ncbi:MAG TPA: VWA domain-containing protein [Pyrinomonadaceae bacterium]
MKQREVRTNATARFRPSLLILFALAAALLPAPSGAARPPQGAADGRPRRASTTANAQTQQTRPTNTPTPQPAKTSTPRPTPTPDDDDEPPPPRPRLQTSPGVTATPTPDPNAAAGQEIGDDETITIDTRLVNLNVRVVDRDNRPIKDVRKEDFKVFDNNVPQTVEFFETREVPISYGVVVDNSGSLRGQINQVIDASKTILESNREGDETFIVRFVSSDEIKILQDWTANKQDLFDAVDDMFVEGGQTAVIDAVMLATEHASERRKGNDLEDKRRRALILVTDGEDRASFYKERDLFESMKERDVQIFVIGFVNELEREGGIIKKSKREKAVGLLDRMAKETGGRAFYPTSLSDLPGIALEITKDMRTQFVLGYVPSNPAPPGEFRPVRVQVANAPGGEKRIAITRAGYTAQRGSSSGGAPATQRPNGRPTQKP